MAHYLRDEQISNISISADNLAQLSGVFADRAGVINANRPADDDGQKRAFLTYIIRFDNKGYRVFNLEDLLRYFQLARTVERVLFTVETGESLSSNRQRGSYLELRLDEKDPITCFLTVTSDDRDWVDASFSAVHDVLTKCKNRNGWARTLLMQCGVQIFGVTSGFIFSLWAAAKIAPKLAIENSFLLAFLFVLLIFSNVWTYLNRAIIWLLNTAFPNLKFYRPDKQRLHWLMQTVVGSIVLAVAIFAFNQALTFLNEILSGLIRTS